MRIFVETHARSTDEKSASRHSREFTFLIQI